MNLNALTRFFRECRDGLLRITRRTFGEYEVGDVENTAYEIAAEIEAERGYSFDFDAVTDRDQLLRYTHARLVKFADKQMRYAVSLSEQEDDERPTQGSIIMKGLAASEDSDPSALLEREARENAEDEALMSSYSELVAYLLLQRRFDTRKRLAEFIGITASTLRFRFYRAERRSKHASLFDGIESIDADFQPTLSRWRGSSLAVLSASEQWEWAF